IVTSSLYENIPKGMYIMNYANHKNKNYMKKIILALVLASVSVTCFGCNKKDSEAGDPTLETQETLSLEQAKWPLTFSHDIGAEDDADATEEPKEDATEGDAKSTQESAKASTAAAPDKSVTVTEHVEVTDASGQPVTDAAGVVQTEVVNVTEKVQVTNPSGQPVTNASGTVQTEVVNVTQAPPATDANNSGTDAATEPETVAYTPVIDVCRAYWLDMSQTCDFFFDGEFLVINFQVNEGIPDGNYPVTFKKTDIASWDVKKWDPVCINGEVAVNSEITAQDDLPESDFGLKINSVAAKQGDTVQVTIDLSNNPGFCGFVVEVEYDKSAMKIISTKSGADFDSVVNYVAE
ncbi:MAG: hypothetical protein K2H89_01075, partial [Oscillospiraceae bacterium]|nr:hypothetical protein [Oscillospiraceae bacterium]